MQASKPGTTLDGRYTLTDLIDEGWQGALFRARDEWAGTEVTVRVLHSDFFEGAVRAPNVLQLQRSRSFVHPSVVPVQDIVLTEHGGYVVSGAVAGEPLMSLVGREGALDRVRVVGLLENLAAGLSWIHQIGECGSISPATLWISEQGLCLHEPYFLRRRADEPSPWAAFQAPEQAGSYWQGGSTVDIYAGAMVMAYALGGAVVGAGTSLGGAGIHVSPGLESAFLRATAEVATDRPGDLGPLLRALREHERIPTPTMEFPLDSVAQTLSDVDTLKVPTVSPSERPSALLKDDVVDSEPIDIDLTDPRVTVVSDATLSGEPQSERRFSVGDATTETSVPLMDFEGDATTETSVPLMDMAPSSPGDMERDTGIISLGESALVEFPNLPLAPGRRMEGRHVGELADVGGATETLEVVSDAAIFAAQTSIVPSPERDDYDTLETELGSGPSKASRSIAHETQAFTRPGLPAAGRAVRDRGDGRFKGVALALCVLAVGLGVYTWIQRGGGTLGHEGPKSASHAALADSDQTPSFDVTRVPMGASALATDIVGDVEIADPDVTEDLNHDEIADPDVTEDLNHDELPKEAPPDPATSIRQFACPPGMSRVPKRGTIEGPDGIRKKTVEGYCVERFEYPGRGSVPHTNVALAQAQQACRGRGRRLCSASEWRAACGGKFPYRGPYEAHRCNTVDELGSARPLGAAGSFSRCKNGYGLYDMVGNAAEWTRGGRVHGGSAFRDGRSSTCNRSAKRFGASPKVGFRCCADAKRKDL